MYQGTGTSLEVKDIHELSPGDLFLSHGFGGQPPSIFVVVDSGSSSFTACIEISSGFQVRHINNSRGSSWPVAKVLSSWRLRNPPSGITSTDTNTAITTPGNLVFCESGAGLTCHGNSGGFPEHFTVWLSNWKLEAASNGNYWVSAWSIEVQDKQSGEWHKLELSSKE